MGFVVGDHYMRRAIHEKVGGGEEQSYLPQQNGKIIAGFFKLERNPGAPREIQVGKGPRNVRKAELLAEQDDKRIPVFMKRTDLRKTNKPWQYHGEYEFSELLNDSSTLKEAEEKSGRHGGLTYVLRLKQVFA
jgi:hypothetical protein